MKFTKEKICRRIRNIVVGKLQNTGLYHLIYLAYIHSLLFKACNGKSESVYLAARPNPGAGIGHQLANWMAGFYYAKFFNVKFAHIPFSSLDWEVFFDFGSEETSVESLVENGFKIRRIPLFEISNANDVAMIKKIVSSYSKQKVVLLCEQDQFLKNLPLVIPDIQRKFFNAEHRKSENLVFNHGNFNVAIHVRRGDIMTNANNPNLTMRILSNDYFENVLANSIEYLKQKTDKPIHIYFFSQGKSSDYPEFEKFENLHWCFEMNAKDSFLHMIYADALITSKSSFSYKPALLNKFGIKICPENFWHSYPNSSDWIMADEYGTLHLE